MTLIVKPKQDNMVVSSLTCLEVNLFAGSNTSKSSKYIKQRNPRDTTLLGNALCIKYSPDLNYGARKKRTT